jgi:hypothetical protein
MHTCKKIKEVERKKDHNIYSDQSLASDGPKQAPKATPQTREKCTHIIIAPSINARFSPWRKFDMFRQCLQQENDRHRQLQPMNVIHSVFTMKIETRYSRSTTKSKFPQLVLSPQLAETATASHQSPYSHALGVVCTGISSCNHVRIVRNRLYVQPT